MDESFSQISEALHRVEEMLHRQGEKLHFERERHEELEEVTKKDKIEFLAISAEERDVLDHFFDESKVKMKSWVAMDREESTMRAYNIKVLPTAVVIDKAGTVIAVTQPGDLTVEDFVQWRLVRA